MKVLNRISFMLAMTLLASMTFMSCTKEGPAGLAGKDGKDGEDGINGQDGTATCIQCHDNSQSLASKTMQWEASYHATGDAFARNTGECAICHTSQGFLGNLDGTFDWEATGAIVNNPNPPNCYTCHAIHDSYTPGDWGLTVSGAVAMRNTAVTFDFGKGSVCASCHQGRTVNPFPTVGGADITISNTRYGVHHGPMANVFTGVGLFNVGTGLSNSLHTTMITDACVTCHLANGYGAESGGHTMWMRNGSGAMNTAGCIACHADVTALNADIVALQTQVAGLLAELKTKLDAIGATNAGSDNSVAGTYAPEVAGAVLNYKAITEDKSLGVHNPTYVVKLLQNTIAALD
ncbi:MAG: hypothetical protein CVT92_04115 [Bacteroidetes bacterium HGW-Bacteroidetes-1]|jgi:hypothetical protein|nr:MAG: hypothetical protein CVT92_04115 [Bacteroidetes bacterium HGW-Bacteroidetes-1]